MHRQTVILEVAEKVLTQNFDWLASLTALNVGLLTACDRVLGIPLREVYEDVTTLWEGVLAAEFDRQCRRGANLLALGREQIFEHPTSRGHNLHGLAA